MLKEAIKGSYILPGLFVINVMTFRWELGSEIWLQFQLLCNLRIEQPIKPRGFDLNPRFYCSIKTIVWRNTSLCGKEIKIIASMHLLNLWTTGTSLGDFSIRILLKRVLPIEIFRSGCWKEFSKEIAFAKELIETLNLRRNRNFFFTGRKKSIISPQLALWFVTLIPLKNK